MVFLLRKQMPAKCTSAQIKQTERRADSGERAEKWEKQIHLNKIKKLLFFINFQSEYICAAIISPARLSRNLPPLSSRSERARA